MNKKTQKNLLELVKRNYEEIAEDFNTTRKKHLEPLWSELVNIAQEVKDGQNILDVGCGNGRLLRAFKDKKISYLGVDSCEELIEAANKNFQFSIFNFQTNPNFQFSNKIPRSCVRDKQNVKFVVGDILELDKLPEHDFDYVFCIAVLHHLPGDELRVKALEQMKNKIKPGGKIIIITWNLWGQKKFRELIFKYGLLKLIGCNKMDFNDILFDWKNNRGEKISQRYYHAFTKNELKKIAISAGLKIDKLYKDKYNYYVKLTK